MALSGTDILNLQWNLAPNYNKDTIGTSHSVLCREASCPLSQDFLWRMYTQHN